MARLWLKVEPAICLHPKAVALADLYGVHPYLVVGFLVSWWGYCADYGVPCPEGRLRELAKPLFSGREHVTIPEISEALEQVGLMGPDDLPNDWLDYTGGLIERRAKDRRRVSKRRSLAHGSFTVEDWRELLELTRHRCAYCGVARVRLGQDHVLSLSRGGAHVLGNILPCCRSCNSRKGARSVVESGLTLFPEISVALRDTKFAVDSETLRGVQSLSKPEKSRAEKSTGSRGREPELALGSSRSSGETEDKTKHSLLPVRRGKGLVDVREHLESVSRETRARLLKDDARRLAGELIFAYWCSKLNHETALYDEHREKPIVRALLHNRDDVSELLYVVDGAAADEWACTELKKHDIPVLFRDRTHIEKYLTTADYLAGKPHPVAVKYLGSQNGEKP